LQSNIDAFALTAGLLGEADARDGLVDIGKQQGRCSVMITIVVTGNLQPTAATINIRLLQH
jgi:hypothetical protein